MPAGAGYDLQLLPFPLELYLIPLSAFFYYHNLSTVILKSLNITKLLKFLKLLFLNFSL